MNKLNKFKIFEIAIYIGFFLCYFFKKNGILLLYVLCSFSIILSVYNLFFSKITSNTFTINRVRFRNKYLIFYDLYRLFYFGFFVYLFSQFASKEVLLLKDYLFWFSIILLSLSAFKMKVED